VGRGDILVSSPVAKLTSADIAPSIVLLVSGLPLGKYLSTAEIARLVGVNTRSNVTRNALKLLHERGEVDRINGATTTGTTSYRWGRYATAAEVAEADARASARIEATRAKFAGLLAVESECFFPECEDTAPVGQRYCPAHEEGMAADDAERRRLGVQMGVEPTVSDLMAEWDRQRGGPRAAAGRSSWSYYGDKPDPFDGVPPDN
jgi:hypothetical protein